MSTIMVVHDDIWEDICSLQVGSKKVVVHEVITWVLENFEVPGHGSDHVMLKSDQQESIIDIEQPLLQGVSNGRCWYNDGLECLRATLVRTR